MSRHATSRIRRSDLARLRTFRLLPNLLKIPLFTAMMAALTWVAWTTPSTPLRWAAYVALGYLWMSMVTFMHDATHNTLFRRRALNRLFGIVCMIPIPVTFVAFREDHIEHHRHNRSPRDPDAFTMGRRGPLDFLLFYAYAALGGLLSVVHFNVIYPVTRFRARLWAEQAFELALKTAAYAFVLECAEAQNVLVRTLEVWLWPVFVFSLFNSMRFIAEHYGTPWDSGQMAGSRTVTSNRVHSFFWNNINWHIGHHVYPSVPWYNLVELHQLLAGEIATSGALVDRSYVAVYWNALCRGPETAPRLEAALASRHSRSTSAPTR